MKFNIKQIAHNICKSAEEHAPEILTWTGVIFAFSSGVLTHIAYTNVKKKIDESDEEVTPKEKTIIIAKEAVAPVATMGTAIVLLHKSGKINAKRYSSLAAAYAISETRFKEYKDKVVETVGDKKEKIIHDKAVEETVKKNEQPIITKEVVVTGAGETICIDTISNQRFKSDINKIRKIENSLNYRLRNEMYISLNEFYSELGIPPIKIGDDIGWNIENGEIEIFTSAILQDDVPCIALDYNICPRHDYRSLY